MIPIRDLNPTRSTPWATWTVLVVCGLVYLWQAVLPDGASRDFVFTWGMVPRRLTVVQDPQAWLTVLTSMFMHGGFWHVLGNLWFLHVFGDNVEDNMGTARFTVFYLLCGAFAALTQLLTNPTSPVPMVGASGAIAGVLAAYLVLFPRAQVVTLIPIFIFLHWMEIPAFVFIALWFVYQFFAGVTALGQSGGGVAYWAHIGGFVAGLALVWVFRRRRPPPVRVVFSPPRTGRAPWHDDRGW
jgi:membrane associated rhomboid family serine protease